jgi:hypothetical protein
MLLASLSRRTIGSAVVKPSALLVLLRARRMFERVSPGAP